MGNILMRAPQQILDEVRSMTLKAEVLNFQRSARRLPQIRLREGGENNGIYEEVNLVIDQRVHDLADKTSLSR